MQNARPIVTFAAVALAGALVTGFALDGREGYTSTLLLTPGDVQQDVSAWSDLQIVHFWAPIAGGQRDGIAANSDGDVFVLVNGYDSPTTGQQYTGLVRYDGTTLTGLVQDVMSSPLLASRTGSELRGVVTSPTDTGPLTAGDPVVLRQVNTMSGSVLTASFQVLTVDRSTGAETLLHAFGAEASQAKVAIDGSGSARDGDIYVGPMNDGDIARLHHDGTHYVRSNVPIAFDADHGLVIDAAGALYTFDAAGTDWDGLASPYPDHEILQVDPATGDAGTHGYADGRSFVFDWAWDDRGALWMGLRQSGRKRTRYIAEAPVHGTADTRGRIAESDADPWSLAAGAEGVLYVLENPFADGGAVYRLSPSGDPGGGGGGKGKGKNK